MRALSVTFVTLRPVAVLEMARPQEQLDRKGDMMATQVAEKTGILGLENPMGTDGFEFVEYTAPDIELLRSLFTKMGFPEVARHKSKNVTLHKQGDCNFIINAEPGSYAEEYAKAHGPSACAMAFRVKDAKAAHERALGLGATNVEVRQAATASSTSRRSKGIGGSRLFFVDRYGDERIDLRRRLRLSSRLARADGAKRIRSSPTSTTSPTT